MKIELTPVEENYLKNIYLIKENSKETTVKTNDLAYKLEYKAASVTDMLQKLALKKLVKYEKYQGVNLTKNGTQIALAVLRKHRLWELFLTKILNFTWDKVHDIAEQLEHIQSEELIQKMDKYLGFPKFDPHGDPIPDENGNMENIQSIFLKDVVKGKKYTFIGFNNHTTAFLNYLTKLDLHLNDVFVIVAIDDFDKTITIKKKNTLYTISNDAAICILVDNY